MKNKIYLIDGSGYIFRAYYAVQRLSNSSGFPTNALYGFLRMLIKLLSDPELKHVAIIFDAGRDTFRKEIYPEYKANREDCPEDLKQQMPYFREFSKALGLPLFEQVGFEADDIIGTFCEKLKHSEDCEVVVVSGDKDLLQLVEGNVTVWDTMKDRRYDADGVKEKLGVPPEKVVELLGLMGDSSDNIPGVKGVGPKTALQLLELFGDISQVIENTNSIRGNKSIRGREKIAEAIELNHDLLRLSRELVKIKKDVPVTLKLGDKELDLSSCDENSIIESLKRQAIDTALLTELTDKFEFSSLIKDLAFSQSRTEDTNKVTYNTILKNDFENWLVEFRKQSEISFDLETTSINTLEAQLVGASFFGKIRLTIFH
jgi:DNA polymerase-1